MCFDEAAAASMTVSEDNNGDEELCPGKSRVETDLDLYNAVVTNNTLHLPGGKLEYQNVGTVRGKDVNLEVTVYDGEYKTNAEAALLKNGKGKDENGKWGEGMFGNIHLLTVHGDKESGESSFEFCFRDTESDDLVTVDSFQWTVYDLDERNDCKYCIKEKFIIDTSQAAAVTLTPDTEVQTFCESYTLWPHKSLDADPPSPQMNCPAGDRTVFHSSTSGTGADNPTNKDDMTRQQLRRSVQFTFKDTSCFHFTYNHYCPPEEAGASQPCGWYGGGNFLFAGSAAQLIEEGECITSSPTTSPSPTKDPTVSPTFSPTASPTASPTTSPTAKPTTLPTNSPSESPTTLAPTVTVTRPPINTNGGDNDDDFFFQPGCPKDLELVSKSGQTDIDLPRVVKIVSQDESTVKVSINQGWDRVDNEDVAIDQIFYSFKPDTFDQKCFEETNVGLGTVLDTVTISCGVLKPHARLEICLVDNLQNELLTVEDDATVPTCCHPDEKIPETPTVCYTIKINCVTECVDEDAIDNGLTDFVRRGLRGSN